MAYPRNLLTADEEIIHEFHAHWRVLLPAIGWIVLLLVAAGLVGPLVDDMSIGSWALSSALWLLAVLLGLALSVKPVINWLFTQYVLTTERIIVRRGIISRSGVEIPLENINNVHYSQRAIERMLGYGDVMLESAGATGQSRLSNIPDPQQFQSEIYSAREERMFTLERGGGQKLVAGGPRDVAEQLTQLAALHDAGKLTDEEFAAQKQRLMNG
ncbi:PH domain-containing protein [Salsipaludibacter albus]|uniref:PH domain-containing protein n=1 Tax=Salsipaludibacter albus TaxID=2849650 RepID=UPI001EE4BE79|nr:PH domain-containing protein [Salsipaludibacter albus]MBY5162815.1 PH domain-containing protein [Salsipaludibacter albus]